MSTVAKILVVVNLILAAAFVGSASTYLGNQDHWKTKYDEQAFAMQATIDRQVKDLNEKDRLINERTTALQQKDEALAAKTAESQKLSAENETTKRNYLSMSTQLTRATAGVEQLSATVRSYGELIQRLKDQNVTVTAALGAMRDARDAAQETVNRVSNDLDNERQSAQALKARVSAQDDKIASLEMANRAGGAGIGTPQPAHAGKVLAADNGSDVYVLSLGKEDGVKIGYTYVVSRGSQFVAEIVITDVQAKQSAGRAVNNMKQSEIQRGDVATSN